jgi:GGDEF domain-containing protein
VNRDPHNLQTPGGHLVGVDDPALPQTTAITEPPAAHLAQLGVDPNNLPPLSRRNAARVTQPDPAPAQPSPENPYDELVASEPAPNPYDSIVAEQGAQDDEEMVRGMTAWRAANSDKSPDEQVRVLRLAAAGGLPPSSVADLGSLEVDVNGQELKQQLAKHPKVAQYLQDLDKAPVAKPDVTSGLLGTLEAGLSSYLGLVRREGFGAATVASAKAGLGVVGELGSNEGRKLNLISREDLGAAGITWDANEKRINELQAQVDEYEHSYDNAPLSKRALVDTFHMLPFLAENAAAGYVGEALGGFLGGGAGTTAGLETGPGAVASGAAGAAEGGAIGGVLGIAGLNYALTFGPTFYAIKQMRDGHGNQVDDATARAVAQAVAFGNGMLMIGPFAGIAKKLPFIGPWLERQSLQAAESAVLNPSLMQMAKKLGWSFLGHEATGAATMGVVGALNQAGVEIAKGTANVVDGAQFETDPLSIGSAVLKSGAESLATFAPLSAFSAVREFHADLGRLQASRQSAETLKQLTDATNASKLASLMPEEFQAAVRQLKGNGPDAVTHAFVPIDEFNRLAQENTKLGPEKWAALINEDGGKAYQEANLTGGEIAIPIENYLARVVKPGFGEKFAEDVKLAQDSLTPRQAKVEAARLRSKVEQLGKPYVEGEDPSADAVWRDYYQRATTAGVTKDVASRNATLFARVWGNWGRELGQDPFDLYQRKADLRIFGRDGQVLDKGPERPAAPLEEAGPAFAFDDEGAATVEGESDQRAKLREQFDKLPAEQRKRALFISPTTGLYNERGFSLLERPADRPYLAEFDTEGFKAFNDVHGHDAGDAAMRLAARTLRANDIEDGAQIGNSIRAWVDSPEQAQKIADAMTKATGGKLRVTTGVTKGLAVADLPEQLPDDITRDDAGALRATYQAAADANRKAKDDLIAKGEIGHRKGVPRAFAKDLPRIDFDEKAKAAGLDPTSKEAIEKFGLPADSKEAKTAIAKAMNTKAAKDVLRRFNSAKPVEGTQLNDAHEDVFVGHEEKGTTFDAVHFRSDGTLTQAGFDLARKVFKPKVYVSADARGVKAMNDKENGLGPKGTDQVLAEFRRMLVEHGGGAFFVANPHGDEFLAFGKHEDTLQDFFTSLKTIADRTVFVRDLGERGIVLQEGVQFAHGLGKSLDEADRVALAREKERQDAERKPEDPRGKPQFFEGLSGDERLEQLRREGRRVFYVEPAGPDRADASARRGDSPDQRDVEGDGARAPEGSREAPGGAADRQDGVGEGPGRSDAPPDRPRRAVAAPTGDELAAARTYIESLGTKERRAAAAAWVDYAIAYEEGAKRPKVPPADIEDQLARLGVADPQYGYHPERGPKIDKDLRRRKLKGGEEPAELKRTRLLNLSEHPEDETYNSLKQGDSFALEQDNERGYITFGSGDGGGKPRRFNIHLLNADKSTLAHETFHFFAEVMGDVVKEPNAPPALKDDYAKLLKFMGYEGHEQRVAEAKERAALARKGDAATDAEKARLKELTAKEERPAYAWEQYLLEGKAPSEDLVGLFGRFRKWLTGIYRKLSVGGLFERRFGQPLQVSDEIRGVFDRLLASEDEIKKARERDQVANSPFRAAFEAMTPEEQAAYRVEQDKERWAAEDELYRRLVEDGPREQQKHVRAQRNAIRKEVEDELNADPAHRALYFLTNGELPPNSPEGADIALKDENGQPLKLSRDEVIARYGLDTAEALPQEVFAKKGHPAAPLDDLAEHLDAGTGDDLIHGLERASQLDREAYLTSESRQRMADRFPTLLDQPQELAERALEATHNDPAFGRRLLELHALRKLAFPNADPRGKVFTEDGARAIAKQVVATKSVADLLGGDQGAAGYYLRAERESRKRAFEAADAGKHQEAYGHQETALLNFALYREAKAARDELQRGQRVLKGSAKESWRASLGKAAAAYREGHDAILGAIGFGPKGVGLSAIADLTKQVDDDGGLIAFDEDAIRQIVANPKRGRTSHSTKRGTSLTR